MCPHRFIVWVVYTMLAASILDSIGLPDVAALPGVVRAPVASAANHRDFLKETTMRETKDTLLDGNLWITDGGLETSLIFGDGLELPHFAAFLLLDTGEGRETLRRYYERYIDIALGANRGFILESPTWRSSPDWGRKLGYDDAALAAVNRDAIAFMHELRRDHGGDGLLVSGCVGPRGDGYRADDRMSADDAAHYHRAQVAAFAAAGADLVTAITMTYSDEAIGVARAASMHERPCVISFTTETDGRLPSGEALGDAIRAVDAATGAAPAYYMINCAHPDHFAHALPDGAPWLERIRGLRANASRQSHAELDESTELDAGDPEELGQLYRRLAERLPSLRVFGGCCGTDHRHVEQIALACGSPRPA